ncbi:hypothetical protein NIES4073_64900 [Kalymmatonema gypsitolerans NIES-4073]|jgi:hypothetical protein|nr:hypothetical protein NIES4073_64900 [Scytonema sp. NIES-4073]
MLCKSLEEMKIEYRPIDNYSGGAGFEKDNLEQLEIRQWKWVLPRREQNSSPYLGTWKCSFFSDDRTRRYLFGYVLVFEKIETIRAFIHLFDRNLDFGWQRQELESEHFDVECAKKWCETTAQEILNQIEIQRQKFDELVRIT